MSGVAKTVCQVRCSRCGTYLSPEMILGDWVAVDLVPALLERERWTVVGDPVLGAHGCAECNAERTTRR